MTHRWEDLQRSRAALGAMLVDLRQIKAPALSLTTEDIDTLFAKGIDASFIEQLNEDITIGQNQMILYSVGYLYDLWFSVFRADEWSDHAMAHLRNGEKYADLFLRYNALSVDWLTSQVEDEALREDIGRRLENQCPMTNARRLKGRFSTEEIEGFAESYTIDLEQLQSDMADIVGVNRVFKYRTEDAYESGNMEELVKKPNDD